MSAPIRPPSTLVLEGLVQPRIARAARATLDRHDPLVIAVSGSVGKTSTKEAVACVLRSWKRTLASPENQNDELGVPLTVIGRRPSGRNPFGWATTLRRARTPLALPVGSYPECLVLEFGSCHTGDVEYLMQLVTPEIGVLTGIEATHLATYGSIEAVEQEERKVVTMLPPAGIAVVNADDARVAGARTDAKCRSVSYGFADGAEVRATEPRSSIDWRTLTGSITVDVRCGDEQGTLTLEGTLGRHSAYAALAAVALAEALGIPLAAALRSLASYVPPPGRMRCRPGAGGSLVLDDSYNASPSAVARALETLAAVAPHTDSGERIAVLGTMAELGEASKHAHEDVGRQAGELGLDYLIAVGEHAEVVAGAASASGIETARIATVTGVEQAVRAAQRRVKPGDVVLVKGSNAAGMSRVAAALSARPDR